MENFIAYNPVKLHFGRGVIHALSDAVDEYGKNVLLIYGKGSIKRNGIYDLVVKQLNEAGVNITEYSGIKPNPLVDDADAAIKKALDNNVDVIVAVGGGSVIDTAKFVSLSQPGKFKAWDVITGKVTPQKVTPLIAILTLAATGTEMNANAVLQNHTTGQKLGFSNPLAFPKHSFLDPEFTYSVSAEQTTNGLVDLIAHALESYFGEGDAPLSDRFVESIIKEAMEIAPKVLAQPKNYEYRARMMWSATVALNGTCDAGRVGGDWGVHATGHVLSLMYDLAHGTTLSIMYLAWLKLQKDRIPNRIAKLGGQLFGTHTADETIERIEKFFRLIETPVRLFEAGIKPTEKERIIKNMTENECTGTYHKLTKGDYPRLVDFAFEN